MKLIALEEHFTTEALNQAWSSPQTTEHDPNANAIQAPPIKAKLEDFTGERLRQMDQSGVDVQVLSVPPPALQNLRADEAVALARQTNDRLAAAIQQTPARFQGFATLPTPDPEAAASELERAVTSLGFRGALLGSRTGGRNMDQPDFLPIFEAAARLHVPLYLHPQTPAPAVREAYYQGYDEAFNLLFSTYGWGWHIEAGIQAVRLILSGVFDRCPDLQLILGHWGETVPFYLERIDAMSKQAKGLQRPIRDYVRQNFYVTPSGMFSPTYLAWAKQVMGIERILFSTDYPFIIAPDRGARDFVEQAALSTEEKEMVAHGNWERLTKKSENAVE